MNFKINLIKVIVIIIILIDINNNDNVPIDSSNGKDMDNNDYYFAQQFGAFLDKVDEKQRLSYH